MSGGSFSSLGSQRHRDPPLRRQPAGSRAPTTAMTSQAGVVAYRTGLVTP
ncbi:hypothetical protein [Micromonospora arborensis]